MKSNTVHFFILGLILGVGTPSHAQASSYSARMTCEDFSNMEEGARTKAIYWAEGFNRRGASDDAIIDFSKNDSVIPVIQDDCTKDPKATFLSKMKAEYRKNSI